MSAPHLLYATDEDIALRASADFAILCPKDQRLASGSDGMLSAADRWTLSSSSVDFQANGLSPGNIIQLIQPAGTFKSPGEMLVVASVRPNAVSLRRKGQPSGMGQPAGPATGLTQVEFLATTLIPQIARACYDLNRRFGIDDLITGRRSCDLFDPLEVREAAVLTVLYRQYMDMCRGSEEHLDAFRAKSFVYRQELDDLLSRTVVHWVSTPGAVNTPQTTSRWSTRISR